MRNLLKKQSGFTLIELIIVMVIIGILAVLLIPNLSSGPKRARDSQRKSDMRAVQSALEQYKADNQGYPDTTYSGLTILVPNYIKTLPSDPLAGNPGYTYTGSSCVGGACGGYTLTATLEYPSQTTYTVTNQQ